MTAQRRTRPSWRADARVLRPEMWLCAASLVGVLLVEVWQTSQVAQVCLALDRTRSASEKAHARIEFVRADLDRRTTRAELTPLASRLGLAPADAQQVVMLPSEYLVDDAAPPRGADRPASMFALAERASRFLVPEATARGRIEN